MHKYKVVPGYNEHGLSILPSGNMAAVFHDYNAIRLQLAREDAAAIASDHQGIPHLLSAQQITQYHWKVFDSFGIPRSTFGGTPFTGTASDLKITGGVWCGMCDNEK